MIVFITTIIALLGLVLVLMLAFMLYRASTVLDLKRYRSGNEALADLLNYASVIDDGIIVCKNGAFMASFLYRAEDHAGSTEKQRENVSLRINRALASLDSGWMIHVDAVRKPSPQYPSSERSAFPDRVCAAIDEERRRQFLRLDSMYDGSFMLSITWLPPVLAQQKFTGMMFDKDSSRKGTTEKTAELTEQFRRGIETVENRLSGVLDLKRLRGETVLRDDGTEVTHDHLLSFIQYCITGNDHPVRLPENPSYLDCILGGQDLHDGSILKIGRKFVSIVSIEGFPSESFPGILGTLSVLPVEYRWSTRFIFLDQNEAVRRIEQFRKKWQQKVRGFIDQVFHIHTGPVDRDALSMVEDAEASLAEVRSGMAGWGYYTSVIVLMNENRNQLENSARQIEKTIHQLGFSARTETVNTLDAFLGTLPSHGVENVCRPPLNTLNLADFLPLSSIWTGDTRAPCPFYPPASPPLMHCVTGGSTPFRLNLHVRDLGHTFMFGPTGAGKSTHLAMLAAQLRRYPDMKIYVFDKGMSMYPLTRAAGGSHFSISADNRSLSFCPLQNTKTGTEKAFAREWIETVVRLNGLETGPGRRNAIAQSLANMGGKGRRSLSAFYSIVQDEKIREVLESYTVNSPLGKMLDAEEDSLTLSTFSTFEIEDLMNMEDRFSLPVLLYLFHCIERGLNGQPAAIILDEAWLMLGHPVFREKIREWLKVMRKANCLVLMATQSLSDAANSGILDVILESTATKIFLPNVHATDPDAAELYRRMGLNNRQIEILSKAVPKRQYYYVSEQGRRLYDLAAGPLALSFAGVSDRESIAAIRDLEQEYGDEWIHPWLERRSLKIEDFEREVA